MPATSSTPDATDEESSTPMVRCNESCPGRSVFTEQGNTDAWIATDHTVVPEP